MRIVVVSPHLDDGVLSLGAAMARWARTGARVELLTVFACHPDSSAETGGWDGRAGFRTEGEAAVARREEDRRACAILGLTPVWLHFGSVDFERHGDESDVNGAVRDAAAGADVVLVPGYPLTHPDHDWLVRSLAGMPLDGDLGFYAEQPYSHRTRGKPRAPEWVGEAFGARPNFELVPATIGDRVAKWRAIRRYATQLPLLGMRRSMRRGPHAILWEESIAWVAPKGS